MKISEKLGLLTAVQQCSSAEMFELSLDSLAIILAMRSLIRDLDVINGKGS